MENLKVKALNEEFVDIEGFENLYQISNQGRVYSLITKKFLKPCKNNMGYLQVNLCKNGKRKMYLLHRLVATAFLENPLQLTDVNHISEDKTDNRLCNLEWISHKGNCNYGTRSQRILQHPNYKASREKSGKPKKSVLQFTRQGEFVKEYPSTREASRQTSINQQNISSCCNGNKNYSHAGGYLWRFKEEVA